MFYYLFYNILKFSFSSTTTKETTNLSTIEISNNITDQDIVTSENYDTALQNFIEENNYDITSILV